MQIEQAISQLPPQEVSRLRAWINRIPGPEMPGLAARLRDAGWLVCEEELVEAAKPALSAVSISDAPLSETIIQERR